MIIKKLQRLLPSRPDDPLSTAFHSTKPLPVFQLAIGGLVRMMMPG